MRQTKNLLAAAFLVVLLFTSASHSANYQGFGAATPGGSGQPVYRVTNLNDSGPGSFRDAVSRGQRSIVFTVGGEINLSSRIEVKGSFITIDGLSAPSPGITIKNNGLFIRGTNGAHDVIVRGVRVRSAPGSSTDCIQVAQGAFNIVVDHVSTHGCGDGGIDVTHGAYDVTVSWSILAEPLSGHNMLIQYDNPRRITLHHNLFTKSTSRNPGIQHIPATETTVDMRNNLVWDWEGGNGTLVRYGPWVNAINNYYGANGGDARDALIVCPGPECPSSDPTAAARVYTKGNVSAEGINLDARGNESAPFPAAPVDTEDALTAACLVLSNAGVRPLDAVDQRYLSDISLPCGDVSSNDPPPPTADPDEPCASANLALCATASASSAWSSSYNAAKSNDSSGSTRWNSADGQTAGAWLALDFGSPVIFDTVVLKEAVNRITGYNLQYWNGAGWSSIVSGTTIGGNKTHSFAPLTSQRVRLLVNSTISSDSEGTPTISEFEVYKDAAANNSCASANLALCAAASASSAWSSSFNAAKSNDSSGSTRWNSADGQTAGAWLALDFGSPVNFNTVVLKEAFNRINGHNLQYWNGAGWSSIVSGTTIGANKTYSFAPLTSQRVRLLVNSTISSDSEGTPTIYEFEVYGN